MGWYITILQEMRDELGLKGNELIVFAVINGYSQGGQGCFYGSLADLQEICGIASKHTAIDCLKSLVDKGYVKRSETIHNGVKYVSYSVSANIALGVQKMHRGSAEIAPNNKEYINNILSNNKGKTKFQKPSIEDIRAYCLERNNGIDPENFYNFYESKGWVIGKTPMKDWKAAVRTWEQRKTDSPRQSYQPQKKESVFEHNLREMDKMFGTNIHEQTYGNRTDYDEQ